MRQRFVTVMAMLKRMSNQKADLLVDAITAQLAEISTLVNNQSSSPVASPVAYPMAKEAIVKMEVKKRP